MKRTLPILLAALLTLATAHVPAATAASASLSAVQNEELAASYEHLTADFYKKVDRQAALDGARTSIVDYLKKHKVANASLPAVRASDDDATNADVLSREVSTAVAEYASKLEPVEAISPSSQITYAAMAGVLGSVKDKYTVFLSPKEYAALNEGLDGTSFGGVGISYSVDDKSHLLRVENVILDGPADQAGIQADDLITAIDGTPVPTLLAPALAAQKDPQKLADAEQVIVSKALRGNAGTRVRLTVHRGSRDLEPVTITRAEIRSPSVLAKMLPGDIGYVDLAVFGSTTAQELNAALKRLDASGAKAYVLDLRRNGGGYLNAAVDVSSKFISSGPIVSVQSRAGTDTEYDAENTAISPRPLAVLVDQYTASASEITAGAIQDSGVGTLVGTKTFGKGVVQTIFPMRDGSAIKITTARYFTPKGRDINSVGIQPDIESLMPKDTSNIKFRDPKSDPQMIAAIRFLDGKLALSPAAPTR
jgi:carboxyl-terminal processing protease